MLFNMALKNGNLISINEVKSGLKCDCFCPVCNSQLVARKGKIKVHHFAHYNSNECESYGESMLHLLAKKIIEENKYIMVPSFSVKTGDYSEKKKIKFEKVSVERDFKDIRPDIIAWKDSSSFCFIEITVTHGIEEDKLLKIKNYNISTLEINLSDYYNSNRLFDYLEFQNLILNNLSYYKRWIYDKNENKNLKKHLDYLEKCRVEYENKQERKREYFFKNNIIGILWENDYGNLTGDLLLDNDIFHIICKRTKRNNLRSPVFEIILRTSNKEYEDYFDEYIDYYNESENLEYINEDAGAIWENHSKWTGYIDNFGVRNKIEIVKNQEIKSSKSPHYFIKKLIN